MTGVQTCALPIFVLVFSSKLCYRCLHLGGLVFCNMKEQTCENMCWGCWLYMKCARLSGAAIYAGAWLCGLVCEAYHFTKNALTFNMEKSNHQFGSQSLRVRVEAHLIYGY